MKRIICFATMLLVVQSAFACDVCGGSSSGNYFGILPNYRKNYIALKYHFRSYQSRHHDEYTGEMTGNSTEVFNTIELWGRMNVSKKLQLYAIVPFNSSKQTLDGIASNTSSLGDINLIAGYHILNTGEGNASLKQSLQLLAGIKLATGKYSANNSDRQLHMNMQPGSGSYDFPLSLVYTVRYKQTGANAECSYRFNTENNSGYQFGNKLSSSLRFFYWKDIKQGSILPQLGLSYESAAKDVSARTADEFSGGSILHFTSGVDLNIKQFNLGLNYQLPLQQSLSNGMTKANAKFSLSLGFLF